MTIDIKFKTANLKLEIKKMIINKLIKSSKRGILILLKLILKALIISNKKNIIMI